MTVSTSTAWSSILLFLPIFVAAADVTSSLSSHNKISDCWIVHAGSAYDITQWATKHPGGSAVYAPFCGKTGTGFDNALKAEHGNSKESLISANLVLKGTVSGNSTAPTKSSAFGLFPSLAGTIACAITLMLV